MAISFKKALQRIGGVQEGWRYLPLVQQIADIKLDELSTRDFYDIEGVCSAWLTAIRSERLEKAGLIEDPPRPESPIREWDNAYTLRDKLTGRAFHLAELYAMNDGTIRDLTYIAGDEWSMWISGTQNLSLPGHHLAIAMALKKDLGKDQYPKFEFP